MSMRLKLTLTYSLILALTLIIFSTILYFSQVRFTLNNFQSRLAARGYFENGPPRPPPDEPPRRPGPPRLGVYTQIRNLSGQIIERDANLGDLELPLTEIGLQTVQSGQTWVEPVHLGGERFLVQSRLVIGPDGVRRIVQVAGSLIDRDQYLDTLRNILLVGSSIAVLGAFGVGWLLAGLTLRPINRIRQTAQTIGSKRDFSQRVDYSGPKDEIGQLATTFNDMLTELQAAYQQVEQSLQTQQRFVADASHELRTPLTTLRGNIELLQRQPPISPADEADVLADMGEESERLMRLVNDLLVLARADAKQPLRQETIQLTPLLEDICQQVRRTAPSRTLTCDISADLTMRGDPDAMKQVLLILLDNALKHTPPQAEIALRATTAEEQVNISLSDTGPGIKPTLLPHIFDRFYRGDTARTGTSTGLGLAIARELVEAQKGTLTVESKVGQGTTFRLAFLKTELEH
jgi:signal transduction histidine kinase